MRSPPASRACKISLVVLVAVGGLSLITAVDRYFETNWLRSTTFTHRNIEYSISLRPWAIGFHRFRDPAGDHIPMMGNMDPRPLNGRQEASRFMLPFVVGFGSGRWPDEPGAPDFHYFDIGLWPIALIAAILPAMQAWPVVRKRLQYRAACRQRRHRLAQGHCGACGYDLRGLHGRCPECGRAIRWIPITSARLPRTIASQHKPWTIGN